LDYGTKASALLLCGRINCLLNESVRKSIVLNLAKHSIIKLLYLNECPLEALNEIRVIKAEGGNLMSEHDGSKIKYSMIDM
jgi:hypothetical protein